MFRSSFVFCHVSLWVQGKPKFCMQKVHLQILHLFNIDSYNIFLNFNFYFFLGISYGIPIHSYSSDARSNISAGCRMSAHKNEIVEIFFPMWVINFLTNCSKADPARFGLSSEIYSGLGPGVWGGGK